MTPTQSDEFGCSQSPREKPLNHRRLAPLLEQEAVVSVRRIDDIDLDLLAGSAERRRQLLGAGRRIEPVGAERDQQRPGGNVAERVRQLTAAVLPREVEIG